jgi:Ca2+-binding EF-hand superfamily protein
METNAQAFAFESQIEHAPAGEMSQEELAKAFALIDDDNSGEIST